MNKPFIIGITGGSASGKTTFCNNLKSKLDNLSVLDIHMDSYFLSPEKRQNIEAPITKITYRDDNHPSSFDLIKLKNDLNDYIISGKFQVIIIEGLLTLWDEDIINMLDLKLFIDCQADERIVRRLRRNMKERGLSFDEIANVYLDAVRYRHNEFVEPTKWRADFILNGSNPSLKALEIIVQYINSLNK